MAGTELNETFHDSGKHKVLIVDDIKDNARILSYFLKQHHYQTSVAHSGEEAIAIAEDLHPDLILLDLNMPQMNGIDVLKHLRARKDLNNTGVILLTASGNIKELLEAFSSGADDFIQKPYNHVEMLARVQAVLNMRDTQLKLIAANAKLDEFNRNLEKKVEEQVLELEKVNRLRRYFSPQIAETFLSGDGSSFVNERKVISVVFLDLRNFTSFAEKNSPDTVMEILSSFHATVGPIIFEYNATLERFTGDGLMCFLGAPNPEEEHAQKAFDMARKIQNAVHTLSNQWNKKGFALQVGIGISSGEASTGTIGFEERLDYAAIGSVTNMASRLCGLAKGGEILLSKDSYVLLKDKSSLKSQGEKNIKGFSSKIEIFSCTK